MSKIRVTVHALKRWQERGSVYANAGYADVIRAFRESRLVEDDEPIPLERTPKIQLYRHDRADGWFVTRMEWPAKRIIIITFKHSWIFSTMVRPSTVRLSTAAKPAKRKDWTTRDWGAKWPAREIFIGEMPQFNCMADMGQWLRNNEAKFLNTLGRTATHTGKRMGLTPELVDAGRSRLTRWLKEWHAAKRNDIDLTKTITTESSS